MYIKEVSTYPVILHLRFSTFLLYELFINVLLIGKEEMDLVIYLLKSEDVSEETGQRKG